MVIFKLSVGTGDLNPLLQLHGHVATGEAALLARPDSRIQRMAYTGHRNWPN